MHVRESKMANVPITSSRNSTSRQKVILATYEQSMYRWREKERVPIHTLSLTRYRIWGKKFMLLNLSLFMCKMGAIVVGSQEGCARLDYELFYKLLNSIQHTIFPPNSQCMSIYLTFLTCAKLAVDLTLWTRNLHEQALSWIVSVAPQCPSLSLEAALDVVIVERPTDMKDLMKLHFQLIFDHAFSFLKKLAHL